ncbi:MAG: DUF4430 domain-containing protein [Lachnospiraceae bacterium]|nr:DUF4430 domain-containing protein [Lachnospiraceae bacterium]
MNRSQKRILRIGIIAFIVIAAGISVLIGLKIRPADDYGKKLESMITEAEGAISSTPLSQENMSSKEVKALMSALGDAKSVLEDKKANNNDKKSAFQNLTAALDDFNDYTASQGLTAKKDATALSAGSSAAPRGESSAAPPSSVETPASSEALSSQAEQPASSQAAQPESQVQPSTQATQQTQVEDNTPWADRSGRSTGTLQPGTGNSGRTSGGNSNETNDDDKYLIDEGSSGTVECTILIQCKNLVGYSGLVASKKEYVPKNGIILKTSKCRVKEGSTVFDVLKAVCQKKAINLSSKYTPVYGSYYIEGINYLMEKEAGAMSGWIYKVNNVAPNYGCSSYTLKNGDKIEWGYTVNGVDDV